MHQKVGCPSLYAQSIQKIYWYGSGGQALAETDSAGNTQDEYVFFGGARIARRDSANNVTYYFADHLGTSRVVTNSSGAILDDSDFYPFGGERPVTSSSGNTYKFTGYERDSESALDNASARHFSSTIGRFMQPDPLSGSPGNPQSWNRYSYVLNNPLNLTDSSGMDPCDDDPSACDGWFWDGGGFATGWASMFPLDFSQSYLDLSTNPLTGEFDLGPNAWVFNQGNPSDMISGFFQQLYNQGMDFVTLINDLGSGPWSVEGSAISNYSNYLQAQKYPITSQYQMKGMVFAIAAGFFIPGFEEEELGMGGIRAAEELDGSFSIIDWSGYPGGVRSSGPFRILQGSEYDAALVAKKPANGALHRSLGLKGFDIHEIQPVKFGGSPTAMGNKIVLDPGTHSQYTNWWAKLLRDLLGR